MTYRECRGRKRHSNNMKRLHTAPVIDDRIAKAYDRLIQRIPRNGYCIPDFHSATVGMSLQPMELYARLVRERNGISHYPHLQNRDIRTVLMYIGKRIQETEQMLDEAAKEGDAVCPRTNYEAERMTLHGMINQSLEELKTTIFKGISKRELGNSALIGLKMQQFNRFVEELVTLTDFHYILKSNIRGYPATSTEWPNVGAERRVRLQTAGRRLTSKIGTAFLFGESIEEREEIMKMMNWMIAELKRLRPSAELAHADALSAYDERAVYAASPKIMYAVPFAYVDNEFDTHGRIEALKDYFTRCRRYMWRIVPEPEVAYHIRFIDITARLMADQQNRDLLLDNIQRNYQSVCLAQRLGNRKEFISEMEMMASELEALIKKAEAREKNEHKDYRQVKY